MLASDDDLVAISHHRFLTPGVFEVQVVAVSLGRQGQGIGRQVLSHLHQLAVSAAGSAEADHVTSLARVRPANEASRRLMAGAGFGVAASEDLIDQRQGRGPGGARG